MQTLFIDTSFWKALIDANDTNHKEASKIFSKINQSTKLITSNYVFSETLTLLLYCRGLGHNTAIKWGRSVRESSKVQIRLTNEKIFEKAWKIFEKFNDKQFSFVDCTSFVLIEDLKIDAALTFDRHFEQYGIKIVKGN